MLVTLGCAALAVSFAVETASWWVRAYAPRASMGLFISRSNILLYAGRFFALVFSTAIAIAVETGSSARSIGILLALSFALSACIQITLFSGGRITHHTLQLILRCIRLPREDENPTYHAKENNIRLSLLTFISTAFFGLGLAVPLLLAAIFPQFRLSIANSGQIINAGGMVILLVFVDQHLFKAMDRGELLAEVRHYSAGRKAAFVLLTLLCLAFSYFASPVSLSA